MLFLYYCVVFLILCHYFNHILTFNFVCFSRKYFIIFSALNSSSQSSINIILKHLGPRFLSLQLPGFSLLVLDLVNACNLVLKSSDLSQETPRTEAVSILSGLLSLPDDLSGLSVLEPEENIHILSCPDIKVMGMFH